MTPTSTTPDHLGLAEAYIVAQSYLTHVRSAPSRVDEPLDGIVEMEGSGIFSRVKFDQVPLTQGSVLALLRAAGETDQTMALFSPSGFTHAAKSVAETHNIALFVPETDGQVTPVSTAARLMDTGEPFDSPLMTAAWEPAEADDEPDSEAPSDTAEVDHDASVWRDCPQCGTSHHRDARTCVQCGTDLRRRISRLTEPHSADPPPSNGTSSTGSTLRCRSCGSGDIEMVSNA